MANFSFLGINGQSNLNIDLINKLKTAELSSKMKPEETRLNFLTNEKDVLNNIKTKTNRFLESVSFLKKDSTVNAFNNLTADINGTSATVKSNNNDMKPTSLNINVNKLAQKDVYQSILIDDNQRIITDKDEFININGTDINLKDKTYRQVKDEINSLDGVYSSLEKINRNQYRLIIKSEKEGLDGAIKINSDNRAFGFTNSGNHLLTSQNSDVDIDGVKYEMSTNNIKLDNGVEIYALKEGFTSVKITQDNSLIPETVENMLSKYNELNSYVNDIINNNNVRDKSSIREMMNQIKNEFFGNKGENSLFAIGVNMEKNGSLHLDKRTFNNLLEKDFNRVKNLFTNDSRKGIADKLNDVVSAFTQHNGVLSLFEKRTDSELTMTTNEIIKINESLDKKYNDLSLQFSSYNTMISQMNASFESLNSMIKYTYADK